MNVLEKIAEEMGRLNASFTLFSDGSGEIVGLGGDHIKIDIHWENLDELTNMFEEGIEEYVDSQEDNEEHLDETYPEDFNEELPSIELSDLGEDSVELFADSSCIFQDKTFNSLSELGQYLSYCRKVDDIKKVLGFI